MASPISLPYDPLPRTIEFSKLDEDSFLCFDYDDPCGVKLVDSSFLSPSERAGDNSTLSPEKLALLKRRPLLSVPNQHHLSIWLHVVDGCNFSCHYCYVPHLQKAASISEIESRSFPKEELNQLVDSVIGYCKQQSLNSLKIKFAGGEPTLNLPLVSEFCNILLSKANGLQVRFGLLSNGSFEPHVVIPVLQKYSIKISISIDGFENTHDRIRFQISDKRKIGSWNGIIELIDALQEVGINPYLLYTVTRTNYTSIESFAKYAHSKHLGFRLSLVRSNSAIDKSVTDDISDYLCSFYQRLGRELSPHLPIFRYAAFAEWNLYRRKYLACDTCSSYFAITNKGGVSTCQMTTNHSYGLIKDEDLGAIVKRMYNAEENRFLSHAEKRIGACTKCKFFHVCASGCPQHNRSVNGSTDSKSPWCEVYGRLIPIYIEAVGTQLKRANIVRLQRNNQ